MKLLHGHIFKNGGTTFEGVLNNSYGSKHLIVEDEIRMHREKGAFLDEVLEKNSLKALSSHFLPVQDALKKSDCVVVVFLRDPIERALSVYEFEKKQKHDTKGAINAKAMTTRQYFEWRLSPESPPTIRDYQTKYLLQVNRLDNIDVREKVEILNSENNLYLGVVENFHDSVVQLNSFLKDKNLCLDVEYENRNQNRKTTGWSKNKKYEYLIDMLGETLFDRLLDCNENDIALYERFNSTN